MPDDTTPAGTATHDAGTGETPTPQPEASAPATTGANGSTSPTPITAEAFAAMQAALKKANAEAAASRKKVEAHEAETRKKAEAELTETEKAQKRIAELEKSNAEALAKLTAHERRQDFRKAAAKAKVTWANPQAEDDAFELSGLKGATDESDVDSVVKALVKERPYLLQAATPPPNINSGDRPNEQPPVVPAEEQVELANQYGVDPKLFKLKVSK